MRFWWSWIEQRGIDTSMLSSLDVWGMATLEKFLFHDWLMLCSSLFWYSPFSRFGGIATIISRLKFLVSGYFIHFPDYHYHMAATTTFSGWAYFVTFGSLNFGFVVPLKYHFNFAFHRFPIRGPEKSSKLNNIILGIWTLTHLEVVNKWEHSEPFRTCKLGDGILVFFPQFFRSSNVSFRMNVGRTVKSPNAQSTVGKFLEWFAACFPFSLSSSICLANFAFVFKAPLLVRVIYF